MEKLTITKAAEVVQCHPETLRRPERKGLIEAKRDYRGFRIFEFHDLLKLKKEREKME